jgi:hypothetical protein
MKQQILNLKKKLLIVELPEGTSNVQVIYGNNVWYAIYGGCPKWFDELDIKIARVKALIGKLTDIAEEQFAGFVSNKWMLTTNSDNVLRYKDYMAIFDPYDKSTAKESFFSYLEKEGVYFENPLNHHVLHLSDPVTESQEDKIADVALKWQEAEQKVWKLENTYLFQIL